MVTIVNDTVAKRVALKSYCHKEKKFVWLYKVMDVNSIYCGDHFAMCTNIEVCCTPETYINYTSRN